LKEIEVIFLAGSLPKVSVLSETVAGHSDAKDFGEAITLVGGGLT